EVGSGGKGAQYYVINTEENDSVPQSSPNYVLPWGNIPEDIMYGNFEPQFTSKNSFILYFEVPEDKARAYNPEKGTTTDWVSNLKRSGLDITDFDVYPVDAMSEEARRVTGNLTEYVNYWKEIASKDGNIYYPFVLSTDNSDENGLVVTEDRDFRREENRKPYFFDFNYKNFLDSTSDMNIEELSGEE
ncbi:hypothetical protein KGY79_13710, partial [Candidatus Bipolaricaulota bacterium]|nr:hypothetical protein [Candidatus Bipolaricaulota bacterium]